MENIMEDAIFDEGVNTRTTNEKKNVFDPANYLNVRLADNENSRSFKIRLILTPDIDGVKKVAIPVEVHSVMLTPKQVKAGRIATGKFKSFICLKDKHITTETGGKCPFCEKKGELFNEANETNDPMIRKSICKQAYKFGSKTTYIARVIERGYENEGVKFWRFNKRDDGSGILDILKNFYSKYKSNGIDIFDYTNGFDIEITLTKNSNPTPGAPIKTNVSLMPDIKSSPLSTDPKQIEEWVNDPKQWQDMYKVKSYDYLKIVAEGETPIFDAETNSYVLWKDPEELAKVKDMANQVADKELGYTGNTSSVQNQELPF